MKLSVNANISSVFALAFKDQSIEEKELNKFIAEFKRLYGRINSNESEENQKNIIADFLKDVYYKPHYEVNTKGRIDLAIHNGKSAKDSVGVIIEAKKPSNKSEMATAENPNVKAFQEILLYYLDERIKAQNIEIKHLIITNIADWFIIDAQDFEKIITKEIINSYKSFTEGALVNENNVIFYNEIAKNFFDKCKTDLPCTKITLEIINKLVSSENEKDIEQLSHYYKLLSPQHLLKQRFANDSNKLNNDFYNELLHIIGLKETTDGGKKIIDRKQGKDRNDGSLIENTINILKNRNKLQNINYLEQFGETEEKQLFSVGLELCITWLNRILFLKLLEGQLIKYNDDGRETYSFLNSDKIKDFDELDELFFEVLAIKAEDRPKEIIEKFGKIPYLNSSLFEQTELEQKVLEINGIKDRYELEIFSSTVLKDGDKRKTGNLSTLKYLFDFLEAYDFASDSKKKIQKERKTIINASVLGLIFEKINGYKDGSFYTPGFITEYMCRETIRKAVIQKFNDAKKWEHENWNDFQRAVVKLSVEDANKIINEVRICDPAVGSGHFLVSALNEMIAIKHDLQIFEHEKNGPFRGLTIKIENDELVTRLNGELFQYNYKDENSQRIQETLFKEKRTVIENCLFGVDINPKSVMICRLRLWIELLKNAYYIQDNSAIPINKELQTLPNIDINIKCGNSLVSRFKVRDGFFENSTKFKRKFNDYKIWVNLYKDTNDKKAKAELSKKIDAFKTEFKNIESTDIKAKQKKIDDLAYQLYNKYNTDQLFGGELTDKQQKEKSKLETELQKLIDEKNESINNPLFANALEWRFEFPEAINEDGGYIGFDAVIGNPPYIRQEGIAGIKPYLQQNYESFSGTADLFVYFIELGLTNLKLNGNFSFIIPNKWMKAGYGKKIREIIKNNKIEKIIDFGDLPVFEEATTYPSVLMISKNIPSSKFEATNITTLSFPFGIQNYISENKLEVLVEELNNEGWTISNTGIQQILSKIKLIGISLGEFVNNKMYRGILTGFNDAFIIDEHTKNTLIEEDIQSSILIKPFLDGKDIKSYQTPRNKKWLIFTRRGIQIEKYPTVLKHLSIYKEELTPKPKDSRSLKGRKPGSYKWFEIQDSVDYFPEFEKDKIVWAETSLGNQFCIVAGGMYLNKTTFMIPSQDLVLLAILNSKLVKFYLNSIVSKVRGGYFSMSKSYVETIPIVYPKNTSLLNEIVKKIIELKKENSEAETSNLETQIDEIVYKLYDLTQEEIEIIEDDIKK